MSNDFLFQQRDIDAFEKWKRKRYTKSFLGIKKYSPPGTLQIGMDLREEYQNLKASGASEEELFEFRCMELAQTAKWRDRF